LALDPIYGGDKPEYFRQMSIGMAKLGYRGVDINMGCPVPNVVQNGKGSGLISRPEVAAELIQAAKAGGLLVSVKTRIGYKDVDEWHDWLTRNSKW
jgi:tRNA-dihydrouridine synthase